ncbi:MAG: PilZ domain-containing protein [Thermoguttaceae bacterium]
MDSQTSSPAEHDGVSQVPGSVRLPPDEPKMWVLVGDERKSATIVDESFGGIGVLMEMADAANLQVGDRLTVLYYGSPTQGQVRWLQRNQETQKVCLGIRKTA